MSEPATQLDNTQNPRPRAHGHEVSVVLYPGCIFFEIALALEQLAAHYTVRFYTPDGASHESSQGFRLQADGDYQALAKAESAAVLVPGGDSRGVLTSGSVIVDALRTHMQRSALMAGICAGNLVLAYAGVLKGRRATHNYTHEHAQPDKVAAAAPYWEGTFFERANLVVDDNVITAQPWAYRHYAAAIAEHLKLIPPTAGDALTTYIERRRYQG